jgi:hypothetical protein
MTQGRRRGRGRQVVPVRGQACDGGKECDRRRRLVAGELRGLAGMCHFGSRHSRGALWVRERRCKLGKTISLGGYSPTDSREVWLSGFSV